MPPAAAPVGGMRQLRVIGIGSQDYVAAPYLLIRSPFAYVTCLQYTSLRLRRATLILKPLGSVRGIPLDRFHDRDTPTGFGH